MRYIYEVYIHINIYALREQYNDKFLYFIKFDVISSAAV